LSNKRGKILRILPLSVEAVLKLKFPNNSIKKVALSFRRENKKRAHAKAEEQK